MTDGSTTETTAAATTEKSAPPRKRGKMRASDYLPEYDKVRLSATFDSLYAQIAASARQMASIQANADGHIAAKNNEIAALKRVNDELIKQRDAAWAKPENMAGSQTVVPG